MKFISLEPVQLITTTHKIRFAFEMCFMFLLLWELVVFFRNWYRFFNSY